MRLLGGGSAYEAFLAFDEITYGPVVVKVVRPSEVEDEVRSYVEGVLAEATLCPADPSRWTARDGRRGIHSRPMGYLLAEMQHIARSHPGATW